MDLVTIVLLAAGLALLVTGAESLVRGASHLAVTFGVSPLVVGLTVVAFGTSAPELAVSVQSAVSGRPDLTLGNVVGSNIFNTLTILGASALIAPLVVHQRLVRRDVPLVILASSVVFVLALDGRLGRLDGLLLFGGILAYTAWAIVVGRREGAEVEEQYEAEFGAERVHRHWAVDIVLILVGLALLVLGSRWLVDGAVEIAEALGLSELVIGLTIVSAGTSLPELATSLVAAVRGERDIAVGNVVGSNLFNLLGVLGLSSLVASDGIPVADAALRFDLPVMLATAVASLPVFFTGFVIRRWEGSLFLGYYVAYVAYLLLAAADHGALGPFSLVMLLFVVPLTVVTLGVVVVRDARSGVRPRRHQA